MIAMELLSVSLAAVFVVESHLLASDLFFPNNTENKHIKAISLSDYYWVVDIPCESATAAHVSWLETI